MTRTITRLTVSLSTPKGWIEAIPKDRLYVIFCGAVECQSHVKSDVALGTTFVSFDDKILEHLGLEIGNRFHGNTDEPELFCIMFEPVSQDIT